MHRRIVSLTALIFVVLTTQAQAVQPDKWTRWASSDPDVTVRSLDFLGPKLFAAGETGGVFTSSSATFGPWSQQNGGLDPSAGAQNVRQVRLGPDGNLYAATTGGLFKAPPDGNWTPVGQGTGPRKLNFGGVQSILFNDATGQNMTVATAGSGPDGVYYTSDGGSTWDKASGMPDVEAVYYLTAAPGGIPAYAASSDGVWVSGDLGRSWELASDGLPAEQVFRIEITPGDVSRLYASTSSQVFESKNGGATWFEIDGGDGQTLPAAGGKRAILLTPPSGGQFGDDRAVVGTEQGVWATVDDGLHWGQMSTAATIADPDMNRVVWSLGMGFSPPSLLAGTAGFGVYSLPLEPVTPGTVTIAPTTNLKPGTLLVAALSGWTGTKPYFFKYQWKRCTGAGCTPTVDVNGATSSTFPVPDSDATLHARYSVTVTATNLVRSAPVSVGSNVTADSDVAGLPGNEPRPSTVSSEQPSLDHTDSQPFGTVFTIATGRWRTQSSNTTITPTFKYRWQRCDSGGHCKDIPGATGSTYTSQPADVGNYLTAYVSGTSGGFTSDWFLADQTLILKNKFPVNTDAPKIVGTPYVGQTLSSTAGGWDGYSLTWERRWLRCEDDGLGCNVTSPVDTDSTYNLTAADRGYRLQLEVTAVGYDPSQNRRTTVLTDVTPVITDAPVAAAGGGDAGGGSGGGAGGGGGSGGGGGGGGGTTPTKPTIKIKLPKKIKVGVTFSVPKSFSGYKSPKYQWLRNGKKISKATKPTYKVARADAGKKISCQITLTPKAGGKKIVVTTKATKIPKPKKHH